MIEIVSNENIQKRFGGKFWILTLLHINKKSLDQIDLGTLLLYLRSEHNRRVKQERNRRAASWQQFPGESRSQKKKMNPYTITEYLQLLLHYVHSQHLQKNKEAFVCIVLSSVQCKNWVSLQIMLVKKVVYRLNLFNSNKDREKPILWHFQNNIIIKCVLNYLNFICRQML